MGSGEDARRAVLGPAAAGVIAPTDALDPLELGPYQIVGSIGRGGMGEIYLARRRDQAPKNGRVRLYALKVLVADDDAEDDLVRMFVDEASIMAEIHHPNVLEVFQFGREGGIRRLEANLVVALAGAAVGDGGAPGLLGDLDLRLAQDGAGDGGAQQVAALVDGAGDDGREDEVLDELALEVDDVALLGARVDHFEQSGKCRFAEMFR
jgi:hypothetical protein